MREHAVLLGHIAEEIAKQLRMNYVFGSEFQELAQGHIVLAAPGHGVIRFRQQSSVWKPKWFLPRTESFQWGLGRKLSWVPIEL